MLTTPEFETRLFIGGDWLETPVTFDVINPATGTVVTQVYGGTRANARHAIDVAYESFRPWATTPAPERAVVLRRAEALMLERTDTLAHILTLEGGKPLKEAASEIRYAAGFFGWYAGEAERLYGRTIPAASPEKRLLAVREPTGVVAAITPWNFPAAMVTRKLAPALAAGCTTVLKPAAQTPLTALAIAAILAEAGVMKGAVNVIPTRDARAVGEEFLTNRKVRKITFTGSTEVGKYLARQSAETVKRVSLELGGHAPFIVFADADLKQAAEAAVAAKFRNAGQTCVCANRIYVQREVIDEFTERFAALVANLKVGDGLKHDTDIGPVIDEAGVSKVQAHIDNATAKGATVKVGGKRVESAGYFYAPTVLTDVRDDMIIMREETFGPVAPITVFDTEGEAVCRANDTDFGLAAYLFTTDLSKAWRVSEQLEYGIIGVNDGLPSTPQAPFGGYKESGLGREGGPEGIEAFLETKYISMVI